jgi:hypothetical protein
MNPLDFLLRNPSGRDAGSIARQRLNARAAVPKSGGGVPRAAGGFLANPIFAAYAIPGYSEQKSRNAAGVIEGTRGPLNELQYIGGELLRGRIPYSKPLNAIETGKYGPTDWNPSANPSRVPSDPGPARGPADRAYQSAKAETAAMVATDPLMQQWSAAQKAKDFTTADQLGKQIWQNKYGGSPMGQPGGAIGSRNPLMDSTFGYQTGMSPGDIAKTITNPSDIPVSPGEAPYQTGDFGTRATSETGYDPAAYGISPEMIEEMKKRLLQQSAK